MKNVIYQLLPKHASNVLFWHIFVAQLKLQPNLLKEVHYVLVAHANFEKNSCAKINYKKQNHALSLYQLGILNTSQITIGGQVNAKR